jgi:hypothetical protein
VRQRALAGLFVAPHLPSAPGEVKPNAKFQPIYEALTGQMRRIYPRQDRRARTAAVLRQSILQRCLHDDFTWPHIGLPELRKTPVMRGTIAWLTDAMADLPVVADRIEFDGTAVMSPGPWNSRPM